MLLFLFSGKLLIKITTIMRIGIDATSVWGLKSGLLNGMISYTVHLVKNLIMSDVVNNYVVYCRGEIPEILQEFADHAEFNIIRSNNRKILHANDHNIQH